MAGSITHGYSTVLAFFLLNSGLCQFNFEIKEYNGLKYLKFHNPCASDDTYCPLTCSQKYRSTETGVCVQCVCNDGNSGMASPWTTTAPPPSTAHYKVVISHGRIYLQLTTPCNHSPRQCPAECTVDTESYGDNSAKQCQFCNCSLVTSPSAPMTTPATLTSSSPASTVSKTTQSPEIVIINGVANLLVDMPCTPRDNVCPVTGCYVDGVVRNSELCFTCECTTKLRPATPAPTTTTTSTSTPIGKGLSGGANDTLMVDGVLKIVVTDPCQSSDNLCPVEGCRVDLTTRDGDVCFECNCRTASTTSPGTTGHSIVRTTESTAFQTVKVGDTVYALLQSPCTPKDNLCLTETCHVEAEVTADRNVCFACVC